MSAGRVNRQGSGWMGEGTCRVNPTGRLIQAWNAAILDSHFDSSKLLADQHACTDPRVGVRISIASASGGEHVGARTMDKRVRM
jgi:hypothetical protein